MINVSWLLLHLTDCQIRKGWHNEKLTGFLAEMKGNKWSPKMLGLVGSEKASFKISNTNKWNLNFSLECQNSVSFSFYQNDSG